MLNSIDYLDIEFHYTVLLLKHVIQHEVHYWSERSSLLPLGVAGRTKWPLITAFYSLLLLSLSMLYLLFSLKGLSQGYEILHASLSNTKIGRTPQTTPSPATVLFLGGISTLGKRAVTGSKDPHLFVKILVYFPKYNSQNALECVHCGVEWDSCYIGDNDNG